MPLQKGRGKLVEYGSGRYGVVLPTHDARVVLKLTTDRSEAMAAAWLAKQKRPIRGIVRYHAVLELPAKHRGRTIYALWREEAEYVGAVRYYARSKGQTARYLVEQKLLSTTTSTAQSVVQRMISNPRAVETYRREAREGYDRALGVTTKRMAEEFFRLDRMRTGRGVTASVERVVLGARLLTHGKILAPTGRAILDGFKRGVFFSDIHDGNIGIVERRGRELAVITDPGNAIPMSKKFTGIKIERLTENIERTNRNGRIKIRD